MIKIIKNNTGSDVSVADTGITIPASSQYTIAPQEYNLWAASVDVVTLITAGTLIVNDGYIDFYYLQGINYIQLDENQVSVVTNIYRVATWKDDFLNKTTSAETGELQWSATTNGGNGLVSGASMSGINNIGHPGQCQLGTGTNATGFGFLNLGASGRVLGGGVITQEWNVLTSVLGTAAQQYAFRFGTGDVFTGTEPANGVYFQYANGLTGNFWAIKTAAASTRTSTTTSVAVVANTWYKLGIIVNAAATSVTYTINDVIVGTITTNIPTLKLGPFIGIAKSAGTTAANTYIDYFAMKQILTTPR